MTKIDLKSTSPTSSFSSFSTVINENNEVIEQTSDTFLSRTGTSPNQMEANLDMNFNRILNLPAAVTDLEPLRLTDLDKFLNGTATFPNLPSGGTTGQVLTKNSSTNYDFSWSSLLSAQPYATRAAAIASNRSIYPLGSLLQTLSFATDGDGGGAFYQKVSTGGTGVGYFVTSDGSIYKLYPVGGDINILQFGAVADDSSGANDSAAAISDCIDFYNTNGHVNRIVFGRGEIYTILSALPDFTRPAEIVGGNSTAASPCILMKRYVEPSAVRGILSFGRFMPTLRNLNIRALAGSGGSGISIINGTNQASIGNGNIHDVIVSIGGFCNYGFYVDGTANTVAPIGARNLFVSNSQFFGAVTASTLFKGLRNASLVSVITDNSGVGGPLSPITFKLDGTATVSCDNVNYLGLCGDVQIVHATRTILNGVINGNVTIDNTDDLYIYCPIGCTGGGGFLTNSSTCTNTFVYGKVRQHCENHWISPSSVIAPIVFAATSPTAANDLEQGYSLGQRWINTALSAEFVLINNAAGAAVWKQTTV
jgi:hypothetical protein